MTDASQVLRKRKTGDRVQPERIGQRIGHVGRKCKLTPEVHKVVVKLLREGQGPTCASALARISLRSMEEYRQIGTEDLENDRDTKFARFARECDRAEASAERDVVTILWTKMEDDPKLAQWWLERRRHREYGKKDRVELTGQNGEAIATSNTNTNLSIPHTAVPESALEVAMRKFYAANPTELQIDAR